MKCPTNHNQRCRYSHGFYCEDCNTFFPKDSSTYRSDELLSSIHMVLNNINVDLIRNNEEEDKDVREMMNKIGIGVNHENYEELIAEAEVIMRKYNKDADSAVVKLNAGGELR